ncbi:hypothetical protein [Nocardioides sp.]|uniref:hypothetical protein n=1 Tax=Nocardioides sp. TaxID=35761 RepID=UPI0035681053
MSSTEPPAGPPSSGDEGMPPPPPTGGAVPPPPPPPPPAPGAAGPQWNIGDALNFGWTKFQANAGQFIIAGLILFVGIAIMVGVSVGLQSALLSTAECRTDPETLVWSCDGGSGFIASLFVGALSAALIFVVAQVIAAGLIRGALGVTEGRPFEFSEMLKTDKIGPVLITSLIVAGLSFVGFLLCYLPGLIVAFFTQWSLYFVIDKGLSPVDAIKASVDLVRNRITDTLIWYIVGGLVAGAGAIACGVGLLVTLPIALLGGAYTYKTLTGQSVAA